MNTPTQQTGGAISHALVLSVALSQQDQDAISKLIMHYERETATLHAQLGEARAEVANLASASDKIRLMWKEDRAQIARMKGALERAEVLCRLVTVRQVIEAGNGAIEAAGLNPYCINEGRAEGNEKIGCYFIETALQSVAKEGEK